MKKILILICLAPVVVFAQQRVPNFPVDSLSGHIQYRLKFDFPGVDKKKIFDAMIKWFSTYGSSPNNPAIIEQVKDRNAIHAFLMGSTDPDYQGIAIVLPTDQFQLKMAVTDGEAVITLSNFEVNRGGEMEPLENFRNWMMRKNPNDQATSFSIPATTPPHLQAVNKKLANRDSDLLDNIDQTANALLRDARKYVKKAQKKGLL